MPFLFYSPFMGCFSYKTWGKQRTPVRKTSTPVPHILERETLLWWDGVLSGEPPLCIPHFKEQWARSNGAYLANYLLALCDAFTVPAELSRAPCCDIKYLTQCLNTSRPSWTKLWDAFSRATQGRRARGIAPEHFWNVTVRMRESASSLRFNKVKKLRAAWTYSFSVLVFGSKNLPISLFLFVSAKAVMQTCTSVLHSCVYGLIFILDMTPSRNAILGESDYPRCRCLYSSLISKRDLLDLSSRNWHRGNKELLSFAPKRSNQISTVKSKPALCLCLCTAVGPLPSPTLCQTKLAANGRRSVLMITQPAKMVA